jgi:hypothetical protein
MIILTKLLFSKVLFNNSKFKINLKFNFIKYHIKVMNYFQDFQFNIYHFLL